MRISDWSSDVCSSDLVGATDPEKQKDLQQVANLLHRLLYNSLAKDYEMVTQPGPDTLRIQAALTGAEKTHVALRTLSSRSEERRVGKSVSVRVDLGGRRIIKKKTKEHTNKKTN